MKKLLSDKFTKIKKYSNNPMLVIILIIGVFLMTFIPSGGDNKEVKYDLDIYSDEERLENILSKISGAGEVDVMITYYGGSEQSIAYEIKSENEEKSSRVDKSAVMSGNSPVVVQELYPQVKGVIVVAQGAGSAEVKRALSEAVTAVTGVGASRVRVYEKGK